MLIAFKDFNVLMGFLCSLKNALEFCIHFEQSILLSMFRYV